ncbi:MAG: BrnT family toxin [Prevotellaceae bacterium]|jgi:uncharacterized DUF497 family protein|nr:BrnT family toxin [Prevotellaceae bacterium]
MDFEWDEHKREANIIKHGIDFFEITAVFEDEYLLTLEDKRKDYGEKRYRTIGMVGDELLIAVIHTDRENAIRIISARRAKKKERRDYYGNREIHL